MEIVEVSKVDSLGRVYLREAVRKLAGIHPNSIVEIIARPGEVIIKPRKSIAEEARGIFKLKREFREVKDIDKLAIEISAEEAMGEVFKS